MSLEKYSFFPRNECNTISDKKDTLFFTIAMATFFLTLFALSVMSGLDINEESFGIGFGRYTLLFGLFSMSYFSFHIYKEIKQEQQ